MDEVVATTAMAVERSLRWSIALLSAGLLVSAVEWLRAAPLVADGGLMSARVTSTLPAKTTAGHRVVHLVGTPTGFRLVAASQSILAAATISLVPNLALRPWITSLLIGLVITQALLSTVLPYGKDGGDDMTLVVACALVVGLSLGQEAHRAVSVFLVALLSLAYFSSGIAKLGGQAWRDGSAVGKILRLRLLGTTDQGRWPRAENVLLSRTLSWGAVTLQLVFPLLVVIGGGMRLLAVALAAAFHIGLAIRLGLGRFAWAFGSCLVLVPAL